MQHEEAAKNALKEGTDISAYNTDGNKYVFPSDGYVRAYSYNANTDVAVSVYGANGLAYVEIHAKCVSGQAENRDMNALYVKKGMKAKTTIVGSNGFSTFYPFT